MSLRHLQEHLPWSIPYSDKLYDSQRIEHHRYLTHDLLHVYKSMGKVAAIAERIDHGDYSTADVGVLANNIADLVICALHMAKMNPCREFDLQDAVVERLESRNSFKYPREPTPQRSTTEKP